MGKLPATQFRLRTLMAAAMAIALLLSFILNWDAIPGTFYRDGNGFPHGTGQTDYLYNDGSLMVREWYYRGLIYRATWFEPNGREIATETYDKRSGGIGYYLRPDGSLKSKHVYKYSPEDKSYVAVGPPVYYDLNGHVVPEATKPIQ